MAVSAPSSAYQSTEIYESEDNSPLSEQDKNRFVKNICSHLNVTEEVALQMLSKMKNSEVRTYLSLANGDKGAIVAMLDPEVQELLGYDTNRGVFGNPFGDMFIHFLILNYSLGVDIRKLTSQIPFLRFQESIDAAGKRRDAAVVEFVCAMMSAATFVAFGCVSFVKIKNGMAQPTTNKDGTPSPDAFNPYHPKWQWMTPPTANAFANIFTAGGSLGKALLDYKGAVHDANAQLMESAFQQLMAAVQAQAEADRSYQAGL